MNPAAAVRKRKEAHPELYCADSRCLWYIGPGGKPCANHPLPAPSPRPEPLSLTEYDQVRANVAAQAALREERAAAGLCRNCGRPAVPWSRETLGRVCTFSENSYSCAKPLFDDVEDQRLPAVEDAP